MKRPIFRLLAVIITATFVGTLAPGDSDCAQSHLLASFSQFQGINYGPYHRAGQSPDLQSPISPEQIAEDLGMINGANFTHVKTFALDNGLDHVPSIAKSNYPELRIWLGVYETSLNRDNPNDTHATQWQLERAISLAADYDNVAGIVLGDECLTGDDRCGNNCVSVSQLLQDFHYVSQQLTARGVRARVVLTTDLSFMAASNPAIRQPLLADSGDIDAWMINFYPYYASPPGQTPGIECTEDAIRGNLDWDYNNFQNLFGSKPMIVGETGWPTAGSNYGYSQPSISCQQAYFRSSSKWLKEKNWSAFFFEFFDEPWKSTSGEPGGIGPHWGLCYSNGVNKWSVGLVLPVILPLLLD